MKASLIQFAVMAATLAMASVGLAHEEVADKLKIEHPWVRAASSGARSTIGGVFEIKNDGDEPETLLSATVEGAGSGVLCQIVGTGEHTSLKPLHGGLVIKPHASLDLSSNTYQFQFSKITRALVRDATVNGTLVFEKLHSVPVHFVVEPGDAAPKVEVAPRQGRALR